MGRRDYYNDPKAPQVNSIVPAVTVVVTDGESILLLHRVDNGKWALPGGAVEFGESVPQTAIREVKEETGLEIEITGIVGIYSDPLHVIAYDDGEVRQQFAICLRGNVTSGELRNSSESTEVAWIPASELDSLDLHPTQKLRLDHALSRSSAYPYIG